MAVGAALDRPVAYFWRGAHHFELDATGDWTLAVRPDSAGRIRLETCHLAQARATSWSAESDLERVRRIALESRDEVLAEVG